MSRAVFCATRLHGGGDRDRTLVHLLVPLFFGRALFPTAFFPYFHLICVHCVTQFRLEIKETDNNVGYPMKKAVDISNGIVCTAWTFIFYFSCSHFFFVISTYLRLFPAVDFRWASIWSIVEVDRERMCAGNKLMHFNSNKQFEQNDIEHWASLLAVSSPFIFLRVEIFRFIFLITEVTAMFAFSRRTFRLAIHSTLSDLRPTAGLCVVRTSSVRLWTENSWKKCCQRIRSRNADCWTRVEFLWENVNFSFAEETARGVS